MKTKIAIFCSGSGSNAEKIFEYFQHHSSIEVALLLVNKKDALALERAKKYNIPSVVFNRESYNNGEILETLKDANITWLILAGFLWLVPEYLINNYNNHIINIHPALLPKYGGKGMYGHFVHEAVVSNKELESGITIHLVNANYDDGKVLFQTSCPIDSADTAELVASKVLLLEHKYYSTVIEKTILGDSTSCL